MIRSPYGRKSGESVLLASLPSIPNGRFRIGIFARENVVASCMNMRDVTILRDYRQKTWHFDWRFAPAYPILQAKVAKCPRAPGRGAIAFILLIVKVFHDGIQIPSLVDTVGCLVLRNRSRRDSARAGGLAPGRRLAQLGSTAVAAPWRPGLSIADLLVVFFLEPLVGSADRPFDRDV